MTATDGRTERQKDKMDRITTNAIIGEKLPDAARSTIRERFLAYCERHSTDLSDGTVLDAYNAAGDWLAELIAHYVPGYLQERTGIIGTFPPPERGVLIYGEVGRGKTFMARKMFDFYKGVREHFGGKVRAVFEYDTEFYIGANVKGNDFLEEFFFGNQRKIMFFDDIGNEENSRQYGNVYSGREILRFRHICQEKFGVPTVITTNLTRKTLAEKYDIFVESRVSGYYRGIRLRYPKDRRKERWE